MITLLLSCYFPVWKPVKTDVLEFRRSNSGEKIILFWTLFFGRADVFGLGLGSEGFSYCPTSQCFVTTDRSLLELSDAVIFHPRDLDPNDMPRYRLPHQRWVFFNYEPPVYTTSVPRLFENISSVFNWTMTYRKDSDIYAPYSNDPFEKIPVVSEEKDVVALRRLLRNKKKKVAWFVTNCETESKRYLYVYHLKKHIDVDIYGGCGTLKCKDPVTCYEMIKRDYKFYLAFENSLCRDYVTEKFFNSLQNSVVPVVNGAANYTSFVTKDAFIDINDFSSPKHLADYLNVVDRDLDRYEQYFNWRKNASSWREMPYNSRFVCQLCEKLHDTSLPSSFYDNIQDWWYKKSYCKIGNVNFSEAAI